MMVQIKKFQALSPPPPPPPPPSSSSSSFFSLFVSLQGAMRRTVPAFLFFTFACLFLFAFFFLHLSRTTDLIRHYPISIEDDRHYVNYAIHDNDITAATDSDRRRDVDELLSLHRTRHVSSIKDSSISTVSILLPAWEVLLIVSPDTPISDGDSYLCRFQNNDTSSARFTKTLPFTNRTTLSCPMPSRVKRLRPFFQPVLLREGSEKETPALGSGQGQNTPELIRWSYMVYESFSTENDIVVFAKGLNHRQGVNRPPSEFRCVFGENNAVKTAVTSSVQEVFRCKHPNLTALMDAVNYNQQRRQQQPIIKISLEIVDANVVVPSVAYYTPRPMTPTTPTTRSRLTTTQIDDDDYNVSSNTGKIHEVCACTMVYNVAKFLREWVIYHSKIGVDRFILYDNDSDDDLESVVGELNREGYNVTTLFWIWPKTQEAGFSHSAIYAKNLCKWMTYIDVDEFVLAPFLWAQSETPSKNMIKSLLPKFQNSNRNNFNNNNNKIVGQVSIKCNDFGPSNQKTHPLEGVTQGYTCRRRFEQRHKSVVLLDAVDHSLLNVIHHFQMKKGFRSRQLAREEAVVNHYKYQAWPEFQTKFRRRVSAYVVDWTQTLNPKSQDRTPGLGFQPVEPKGWAEMFCEVRDERLKRLTQRWFGSPAPNGYRMVWQT